MIWPRVAQNVPVHRAWPLFWSEDPCLRFRLSLGHVGCVVAWTRLLLRSLLCGEVKPFGSTDFVFWGLTQLFFRLRFISARAWDCFPVSLRSLVFTTKCPLLPIRLHVDVCWVVIAGPRELDDLFILSEIISLRGANAKLRSLFVDNINIRWVGSRARNSLRFFFENFRWRFQPYWFRWSITTDYSSWIVLSGPRCVHPLIRWRSGTTSKAKVRRRLLDSI